jgi:hypothetical protein
VKPVNKLREKVEVIAPSKKIAPVEPAHKPSKPKNMLFDFSKEQPKKVQKESKM